MRSHIGSDRVVVPLEEIPPGSRKVIDAFGATIVILNIEGRLFAVNNHCPHHGGPLCRGKVSGAFLPSEPYEHRYGREDRVLTCPWHGWQFDIETGEALFDRRVRVPVYEVKIVDDQAVVEKSAPGQVAKRGDETK